MAYIAVKLFVVAAERRSFRTAPLGRSPLPTGRLMSIRSNLWSQLCTPLHFTLYFTWLIRCLHACMQRDRSNHIFMTGLGQDCDFLTSLNYTASAYVSRPSLRTSPTVVMPGRLHPDTPSIGDVVPKPALSVSDTHNEDYIAVESIVF